MACSLTVDAVRERRKTVTRRSAWTWAMLKPGDRLTLVEKAMGLPKGAKQVVLANVEVVANDVVRLRDITAAECAAEGFPDMQPVEFVEFWLKSHGLRMGGYGPGRVSYDVVCRRIEWRYIAVYVDGG